MTTREYLDYLMPLTSCAVITFESVALGLRMQTVIGKRGKRWSQSVLARFGCN